MPKTKHRFRVYDMFETSGLSRNETDAFHSSQQDRFHVRESNSGIAVPSFTIGIGRPEKSGMVTVS